MHPRVRFWLLDVPLAIWRAMLWWHRIYFTFLIVVSSTVLPLMVAGGIICGDDAHHDPVITAVMDTLGDYRREATLWIWTAS